MINKAQISTKLEELPIELIAAESNFSVHADNKITAMSFVMSFFLMISKNTNTLSSWSIELSKLLKKVIPSSTLSGKLQYPQVDFVKAFLEHVLKNKIYQGEIEGLSSKLLAPFNRVLVEDSMCINLPANLAGVFPGAHSKTGASATGRIQYRMDLKKGTTSNLEVQCFRDNDQKFSSNILHKLKRRDLVLRDLGYWALEVFRLINKMEAFFLSRFFSVTNMYDTDTEEEINLVKVLSKAKKTGQNVVELEVLLGKKAMLPVRVVAIRVPQNVEQQRRRKALKENHTKDYMQLLAWTIFVTNVPKDVWTPQEMLQVYGFRWRIEIVFKAWKSQFNFQHLFKTKQLLSAPRAEITIYLLLIWITLFFVKLYNFFLSEVYRRTQKFVSILKFAKFFKEHFVQLHQYPDWDFYIKLVAKHCTYDKREKTPNFCENLYLLKFNELII